MKMFTVAYRFATSAVLCAVAVGPAVADEPGRTATHSFMARPVATQALADQRGGADASLSDLKLTGSVSDTRASNVTTGNNIITNGSLAGASGVPLIVQNSGNNVLIQSATIINVQVR